MDFLQKEIDFQSIIKIILITATSYNLIIRRNIWLVEKEYVILHCVPEEHLVL